MDPIEVFTDGSCSTATKLGGWAAVIRQPEGMTTLDGQARETTSNRMELLAAIRALQSFAEPREIILYTDSKYVQRGITEWLEGWKDRGWKTASGNPVANQDLWKKLDTLNQRLEVQWRWVKGHDGNVYNERADQLAHARMRGGGNS